jgi:hypothetical protein
MLLVPVFVGDRYALLMLIAWVARERIGVATVYAVYVAKRAYVGVVATVR